MLFNRKLKRELALCRQQQQAMQAEQQAIRAHSAVLELTPEGLITMANTAWSVLLNISAVELQGQHYSDCCAAEWIKSREYQTL